MFAYRLLRRRQVIVNLVDGSALAGILFRQAGPLLILKNATVLERGAQPAPAEGDLVVERDRVLFIQAT